MNLDNQERDGLRARSRKRPASFYEIGFFIVLLIYIEYLTKNYKDCSGLYDTWFSLIESVTEVTLLCTVVSRFDIGIIVHNIQKIVKISSCLGLILICFYGLYLSSNAESCKQAWPLGYFSILAISSSPVLYFLFLLSMLIYLLLSDYLSKDS